MQSSLQLPLLVGCRGLHVVPDAHLKATHLEYCLCARSQIRCQRVVMVRVGLEAPVVKRQSKEGNRKHTATYQRGGTEIARAAVQARLTCSDCFFFCFFLRNRA